MNSETTARKYYSKLKRLPSFRILFSIFVIEFALLLIRSLEFGILYIIPFLIYLLCVLLIIREIKLSIFLGLLTEFVYLIFSLFTYQTVFAFGILAPFFGYLMLGKLSELKATLSVFVTSFLPSLISGLNYYVLLYSLIIAVVFHFYIHIVNVRGERITGFKSLTLLRPFLMSVMRNDNKLVEKFLDGVGTKIVTNVGMFKIGNHHFIIPKIHYGLNGEIGSSKFIYQLESIIPNVIVFHGPGDHELDLVTSSESRRVADFIGNEIKDGKWLSQKFYGIHVWYNCGFRGVTLVFSDSTLTFLERPGLGIDDLPVKLWENSVKYNDYIIDCHNEYLKEELPLNSRECIMQGINYAKNVLRERRVERALKIAIEERSISNPEGLCSNKIKVAALSDGNTTVGIVYLYANNADPSLTKSLRESLGKYVSIPLLITPDDHSCTGSELGNLYTPAQFSPELPSLAEKALNDALNKLQDCEVGFNRLDLKGVKVIGKIISSFVVALEEIGGYVMKTFWIPLVLPLFLSIIFIVLT
ncbi:hypothetical protein SUSAZ_04530 [Sulfolobus acidocaldarius SUSAZ]|nr:hypothetical protein SUSAZ_04530 [Sulfolobus acidocaldarius SUSAZ]